MIKKKERKENDIVKVNGNRFCFFLNLRKNYCFYFFKIIFNYFGLIYIL